MAAFQVVRIGVPRWHVEELLEIDRRQAESLGVAYSYVLCKTEEQTVEALRTAQAVLTPGYRVSRRAIEAMVDGKLIVCNSVGFNNVDLDAATERGIVVCNLPLFCVDEVADHTMGLLLACVRKIAFLSARLKAGHWGQDLLVPMLPLRGSVLGLIGTGNIGRRVAERAQSFGLQILAYDPYITQEAASRFGATLVGLDELLARSDFVSLHTPLNDQTFHLMGERQFRAMKPGAFFINTSRGKVVDEPALIRALQEGWIGGAGLDVFEEEPLPADSPLLRLDNVVVTPHSGGYSEASAEKAGVWGWEEIKRFIGGQWPTSVVNPAVKERVKLGV